MPMSVVLHAIKMPFISGSQSSLKTFARHQGDRKVYLVYR